MGKEVFEVAFKHVCIFLLPAIFPDLQSVRKKMGTLKSIKRFGTTAE
jgi:hypothetical protein